MNPYSLIVKHIAIAQGLEKQVIFESGFGDLGYILELYEKYPFRTYIGVELEEEWEATILYDDEEGGRGPRASGMGSSVYEMYLEGFKDDNTQSAINREIFERTFNLSFGVGIEDYIISHPQVEIPFSIGVFSKLFHKFQDKNIPKQILQWFVQNSVPGAYLLVEIMTNIPDPVTGKDFIYESNDIDELMAVYGGKIIGSIKTAHFQSFLLQK